MGAVDEFQGFFYAELGPFFLTVLFFAGCASLAKEDGRRQAKHGARSDSRCTL